MAAIATYIYSDFEKSGSNLWSLSFELVKDSLSNLCVGLGFHNRIFEWDPNAKTNEVSGLVQRVTCLVTFALLLPPILNLITYLFVSIFNGFSAPKEKKDPIASLVVPGINGGSILPKSSPPNLKKRELDPLLPQIETTTKKKVLQELNVPTIKGRSESIKWLTNHDIHNYLRYLGLHYSFRVSGDILKNDRDLIGESILKYLQKYPPSLIPDVFVINVDGIHWTFVSMDHQEKTISYVDTFAWQRENIQPPLKQLAVDLGCSFEEKFSSKIQEDSDHCGVWVLYLIEELLIGCKIDSKAYAAKASEIPKHRKKIETVLARLLKKVTAFAENVDTRSWDELKAVEFQSKLVELKNSKLDGVLFLYKEYIESFETLKS